MSLQSHNRDTVAGSDAALGACRFTADADLLHQLLAEDAGARWMSRRLSISRKRRTGPPPAARAGVIRLFQDALSRGPRLEEQAAEAPGPRSEPRSS